HRRLGHIGESGMEQLMTGGHVNGLGALEKATSGLCEDCLAGKQARRPFDGVHEPEAEIGERVYIDLWGPAQVEGLGGVRWMFHAVDGF
ncbi:hypothetical protein C8F01DRAFT_934516, partial [Mycena amicta]